MIFKSIFQKAHESADPDIRIASLAKLDNSKEKHKQIIHELAFNDDNEKVIIAALEKLDSFSLWAKTYESSKNKRIKKKAQSVCLEMLESETKVDEKLFIAYIKESKSKNVQESLLFNSVRLQQYTDLPVQLLLSLDQEHLNKRFFQERANEAQQLAIIEQSIVEQKKGSKLLNKLDKFARSQKVSELIADKLASLNEAEEKPNKIKQQAKLLNSRLLVLLESNDYEYIQAQTNELKEAFETLKGEFSYLQESDKAQIAEKYLSLKASVQRKLDVLEPDYQARQAQLQIDNEINDIEKKCQQLAQQISILCLQSNTQDEIDMQSKLFDSSIDALSDELQNLSEKTQNIQQKNKVSGQLITLQNCKKNLMNAPRALEVRVEANNIIAKLHEEYESYQQNQEHSPAKISAFKDLLAKQKKAMKQLGSSFDIDLPKPISDVFTAIVRKCNALLKEQTAELKNAERKSESSLRAIRGLITAGKFKPAIAKFVALKEQFDTIFEQFSPRVSKLYQDTQIELSKLMEHQASIVIPKKEELLAKAQAVLDEGFSDPYERSQQVKDLRAEWTSLGRLFTEEDDQSNGQFDLLLEKAFAPCRAFFGELEKQRERNYEQALLIIDSVKALGIDLDAAELSKEITSVKNKFAKLGELNRDKVSEVNRKFYKALKPYNEKVQNSHKEIATQKQNLIKKLKTLVEEVSDSGNLKAAVQQAKELQQKWKTMGFAGRQTENKLWQEFRALNDSLFDEYHKNLGKKKAHIESQMKSLEQFIDKTLAQIKSATDFSELHFYHESQAYTEEKIAQLEPIAQKKLREKLSQLQDTYQSCVDNMNMNKAEKSKVKLFEFLQDYKTETLPDSFESLPSRYKAWIGSEINVLAVLKDLNRTQLTQVAAVIHHKTHQECPIGEEDARKELQLRLMANKLEGNEIVLPEAALAAWVCLGPLNKDDLVLLEKLKELYVH